MALTAVVGLVVRGDANGDARSMQVSKCVQRFLAKSHVGNVNDEELARYVRGAYCEPFTRRGWVYPDGTFRIAAYTDRRTAHCEEASPGVASKTVACPPDPVLDCAALDMVRRHEAQVYIASLAQQAIVPVRCDDDRPLGSVGAESQ